MPWRLIQLIDNLNFLVRTLLVLIILEFNYHNH